MTLRLALQRIRGLAALGAVIVLVGCSSHEAQQIARKMSDADQPDKILFDRSLYEIARNRFDVGRLTLQTLINTYPDSEYLAKAKLAIADSYFKEGGSAGLTQAQAEYKDFITFFPTAPEAPEAQYKIGLAYFRRISKPGRDLERARLAELEFKEFILRYPDSPLVRKVKAKLRQSQELIADANFRIAKYYYRKRAAKAVISRLEEIAQDYPSFSRADESLWMLADTLERVGKKPESVPYYSRIITDFPLSDYVPDSKERLKDLKVEIPTPTRAAVIRDRSDRWSRKRNKRGLRSRFGSLMKSRPNLSATRRGPVHVTPSKPARALVAKGSSLPSSSTAGNAVVVQPLNTGTAAPAAVPGIETSGGDTGAASKGSGTAPSTGPEQEKQESQGTDEGAEGASGGAVFRQGGDGEKEIAEANSKKGGNKRRRGILKRILKPF